MSQLIMVSNRVGRPDQPQAGGLAIALRDALKVQGGIWMGWNGEITAPIDAQFKLQAHENVRYVTTSFTQHEFNAYYSGFANNTLWPMLHSRADLIQEDASQYQCYQQVNRRFAEQIARVAQPEDLIWIHDYHFFSVAKYCRELGLNNRIGFFLHIPFADLEHWQQLGVAKPLLQDLLAYDVIGLQTQADQRACQAVYQAMCHIEIQLNSVQVGQRRVRIAHYPIGVDPDSIQQLAMQEDINIEHYFQPAPSRDLPWLISAERVDYSKGIRERLNAIRGALQDTPLQGCFAALQVACPCRMEVPIYQQLYTEVKQNIAQLNQDFKTQAWQPIYLTHQTLPHHELMQLYRQSQICWVDSLRDGMNLVAKEYIAAQNPEQPGVLILSQYAGAAEQMPEAIIVNPLDHDSLKQALHQALHMPLGERLWRYQALIQGIRQQDIQYWRSAFLADLAAEAQPMLNVHGA